MDRQQALRAVFWQHAAVPLALIGSFYTAKQVGNYQVDFTLTNIVDVPLLKVAIFIDDDDPLDYKKYATRDSQAKRDRDLMLAGWQVITFTGREINADSLGCVAEALQLIDAWSKWLRCPPSGERKE